MNQVQLLGRMVKEPSVKETTKGSVANFTLAVRRNKDQTDFVRCSAFNHSANIVSDYVKKGDMLLIGGQLINNSYEKEGNKIDNWQVCVNHVHLLPNQRDVGKAPSRTKKKEQVEEPQEEFQL